MNQEQKDYYYPVLQELEDNFKDELADAALVKLAKIYKGELKINDLTMEDIKQLAVCGNY